MDSSMNLIIAGLLVVAIILLLLLFFRKQNGDSSQFSQLHDSVGIARLAADGARDEVRKSASDIRADSQTASSALRLELSKLLADVTISLTDVLSKLGDTQSKRFDSFGDSLHQHRTGSAEAAVSLRDEVLKSVTGLSKAVTDGLEAIQRRQHETANSAANQLKTMAETNERSQSALRDAVQQRLDALRVENSEKLEAMRATVDEKLQTTLNERLGASFNLVNENLKRVHESVGEMQSLATGVGDLKRVLSNIKVRGTWGEGSLGALLEQVLTPEQFGKNVAILPGSAERVEFAIRLPGEGDAPVWLPLDVKMPQDDFDRLVTASELGDDDGVKAASNALERSILKCAKDISSKYVHPPHSTDFGVMFLPTESLFAEVVRRPGLVQRLQAEHRVAVMGPTTLMAFLNSLRMGFRTLAIQQRSSEVWQVLSAVKSEFGKFGPMLDKVSKKLGEAQNVVADAQKRGRVLSGHVGRVETLPQPAGTSPITIAIDSLVDDDLLDEDAE